MSTPISQAGQFKALVQWLGDAIRSPEQFTLGYNAEASEFIRFNKGKVRQAGLVQQASLSLKLIDNGRHADVSITLAGDPTVDQQRLCEALQQLRDTLPLLPVDPYLLLNPEPWHSHNVQDQPLPDTARVLEEISRSAEGIDLVGFYASGPISYGYASSEGALGWHQANSFNFDWSLFHSNGQAVKASYAGADWDSQLRRGGLGQPAFCPAHAIGPRAAGVSRSPAACPGTRRIPRLSGSGGTGRSDEHAELGWVFGSGAGQQIQPAAKTLCR